jgi:cyclic-di-AMP phosphodiesterase PgpH
MVSATAQLLERYFNLDEDQATSTINRVLVVLAAFVFLALATTIIAFESIFPAQSELQELAVGRVAQQDIFAPETTTYVSEVLTQQAQVDAAESVTAIYDGPDPIVARQQTDLAQSILDFMLDVREDPYASDAQKISDIQQITALDLPETIAAQIINLDETTWNEIAVDIVTVLERVMRGEIRSSDLSRIRIGLPAQVNVSFDDSREIDVIVAIVSDLLRPNTTLNVDATETAQSEASENVAPQTRSFEAGQLVVASGTPISAADYEALEQLGLLRPGDRQERDISRALLASVIAMVVMGLYVSRFRPALMHREPSFLMLLASIFLLALAGARIGVNGDIFLYPAAALGLLYVAIVGAEIAIIAMIALGLLVGLMAGLSLEVTMFIIVSGIIGVLSLRHAERLNSFFIAGVMIALSNVAVIVLFNVNAPDSGTSSDIAVLISYGILNGLFSAAAAIAVMYIITFLFNLPTALKLVELSQPSQRLLQRLLREAPGTYQHSLQVSNLAEQAANAIGANVELTRVAALYHDIGKMQNPIFFTENQSETSNPHDTLDDPYRSAAIIISHVTEGDELARQYRLPNRIRDFIREHHGTSQVYVFYKQAVILAGDDEAQVDIADFTYPGPKPQSRETGILMLADSCEAAVKSRQPKSKSEIEETVQAVFNGKRKAGELDESGLTLNDLKQAQDIFIDILQAIYHPRINYSEAISRVRQKTTEPEPVIEETPVKEDPRPDTAEQAGSELTLPASPITTSDPAAPEDKDADSAPLAEVPRLRRNDANGTETTKETEPDEEET